MMKKLLSIFLVTISLSTYSQKVVPIERVEQRILLADSMLIEMSYKHTIIDSMATTVERMRIWRDKANYLDSLIAEQGKRLKIIQKLDLDEKQTHGISSSKELWYTRFHDRPL